MKHKAIIFDLDGTAVDSPKQKLPSGRLINAIRSAESAYYICAATGRTWPFCKDILQNLSLSDPCIISGGSQLCNPKTGEILWQSNIEPAAVEAALKVLRQYDEYKIMINNYTEADYLHGGVAPSQLDIKETIFVMEPKFIPDQIADELVAKLSAIDGLACTLLVSWHPGVKDIHITGKNATKEHAIAELLSRLQVSPMDTIGIGDGHNDILLFNGVGHKVAMGNAIIELKAAADEVIDNIGEDGMANYLEQLT